MIRQLSVTEWFARAVAAGLIPEWENVWGIYTKSGWVLRDCQGGKSYYIPVELSPISKSNTIKLRKDGVNLYELEWRKPTFKNMGEYVWMYNSKNDILKKVMIDHDLLDFEAVCRNNDWQYLLADHGAISPTEADFLKVYGE